MRNQKGISLIAIVLIVISVLVLLIGGIVLVVSNNKENNTNVGDNNKPVQEVQKDKVPEEYIGIYTADDFKKFYTKENSLDKNYILMDDIDFSNINDFISIGYVEGTDYAKPFTGTFDGNYHTISNLTFNVTEENNYSSLFKTIKGGTVKNLNMANCKINMQYDIGAGLLAYSIQGSTIENCNIDGAINLDLQDEYISGDMGIMIAKVENDTYTPGTNEIQKTTVKNCTVKGKVTGTYVGKTKTQTVGGAFGDINGGEIEYVSTDLTVDCETIGGTGFAVNASSTSIYRCRANVNIKSPETKFSSGFVGYTNKALINECSAKGNIIAGTFASGFANGSNTFGYTHNFGIKNSYSNCNIECTDTSNFPNAATFATSYKDYIENVYANGKITYTNNPSNKKMVIKDQNTVATNAYYDKNEITEDPSKYGWKGLSSEELKKKSSYQGFDFDNVWAIDEENGTPYLKWEK